MPAEGGPPRASLPSNVEGAGRWMLRCDSYASRHLQQQNALPPSEGQSKSRRRRRIDFSTDQDAMEQRASLRDQASGEKVYDV
jgi:hypothetical protein